MREWRRQWGDGGNGEAEATDSRAPHDFAEDCWSRSYLEFSSTIIN